MKIQVRNIKSGFTQMVDSKDFDNPKKWPTELRRKFEIVPNQDKVEKPKEVKEAESTNTTETAEGQ